MEDYNWISAIVISDGSRIKVRQREAGGVWIDKDERMYVNADLDFTNPYPDTDFLAKSFDEHQKYLKGQEESFKEQKEMLNKMLTSMDANAIADHKAKIDEREYWRKLRGEVFLSLYNTQVLTTNDELEDVLGKTDNVIRALYGQDVDFFKDK